jgi:aconitate hydratase
MPVVIHRSNGTRDTISVTVRIDTSIEVDYYRNGGILPYVLRQLLKSA